MPLLGGCGEETLPPAPPGELVLTVGHETDAWSREPAPVTVEIDRLMEDGNRVHVETIAAPAERISLGRGAVARYELNAKDSDGNRRLYGRSLPIEPDGVAGTTLPLFVSRAGEFARPPDGFFVAPGSDAPAAIAAERFLIVSGVVDGVLRTMGYDLGGWAPLSAGVRLSCPSEPCRFRSFAIVGQTVALGIGDDWAFWFDLATLESGDAPLPPGLASYADVSGGRVVTAPDGSTYVVGATRDQPPTYSVLQIAADGTLQAIDLGIPRAGAAAAWVEGRGLVVAGGSATGAGAEFLPEGAKAFVQLPYPPDATTGAALVPLDDDWLLRAGGRIGTEAAPTVRFPRTCAVDCAVTPEGAPLALDRGAGFLLPEQRALFVGSAPDGETRVVLRDAQGAITPIALREPRRGATALLLPTTHVAVAGGNLLDGTPATSIELFAP